MVDEQFNAILDAHGHWRSSVKDPEDGSLYGKGGMGMREDPELLQSPSKRGLCVEEMAQRCDQKNNRQYSSLNVPHFD